MRSDETLGRRSFRFSEQWQRTGGKFQLWEPAETTIGGVTFVSPKIGRHIRPVLAGPALPEVERSRDWFAGQRELLPPALLRRPVMTR